MNGFARRLVLKQRQKATRKLIVIYFLSSVRSIWMCLTVVRIRSFLRSVYGPWLVRVNCEKQSTWTLRCFSFAGCSPFCTSGRTEGVGCEALLDNRTVIFFVCFQFPYSVYTMYKCKLYKKCCDIITLKCRSILYQNPCDEIAPFHCYECCKIILNNQSIYAWASTS